MAIWDTYSAAFIPISTCTECTRGGFDEGASTSFTLGGSGSPNAVFFQQTNAATDNICLSTESSSCTVSPVNFRVFTTVSDDYDTYEA